MQTAASRRMEQSASTLADGRFAAGMDEWQASQSHDPRASGITDRSRHGVIPTPDRSSSSRAGVTGASLEMPRIHAKQKFASATRGGRCCP